MTKALVELFIFVAVPAIVLAIYSFKPQVFKNIKLDGKKAVVIGLGWIAMLFVVPLLLEVCIGGR